MGPAGKPAVGTGQYIDDQVHIPVSGGQLIAPALVDWGGSYLVALSQDMDRRHDQSASAHFPPATLTGVSELETAQEAFALYSPRGPEFQSPSSLSHRSLVGCQARAQGVDIVH